ncbi:c-type cytochrome [Terrimonas rubra]|uniref:Photosynthetic reaction center cytochrome c subunit n=1 Tax=Terrimonas rubra TaxID=1035890 RepID=A0ABW6A3Y2_9BACT
MKQKINTWTVISGIILMVVSGVAATKIEQGKKRNLKVLPKDISDAKLDSIMHTYNKALGVNCAFCHSPHATIKDSLDYSLDDNPMKEEGRKMIRLTMDINKNYFHYDKNTPAAYLTSVTCITCHRGDPYP